MKISLRIRYALLAIVIIILSLLVYITYHQSNEIPFIKKSVQDRYITYTGEVNVSGKYLMSRCIPENDVCDSSWQLSFNVDGNTSDRIPRIKGDDRIVWFSFQNQEDAISKLGINTINVDNTICKISGHAEINIKDYLEFTAASMGSDSTSLVNVISSGKPIFEKCN